MRKEKEIRKELDKAKRDLNRFEISKDYFKCLVAKDVIDSLKWVLDKKE